MNKFERIKLKKRICGNTVDKLSFDIKIGQHEEA